MHTTMVPYMRQVDLHLLDARPWLAKNLPSWYYAFAAGIGRTMIGKERHCTFPHLEAMLPKLSPRPLLMIHGGADTYIKPEMAEALFGLASEPKELWIVEDAKHNQAFHVANSAYKERVLGFFDKHLAVEPQAAAADKEMLEHRRTAPAALARRCRRCSGWPPALNGLARAFIDCLLTILCASVVNASNHRGSEAQSKTVFVRVVNNRKFDRTTMLHWLVRNLLGKIAAIPVRQRLRAFEEATHHPRAVSGSDSPAHPARPGRHRLWPRPPLRARFAAPADFQKNVPVAPYEYLEPYIRRVTQGDYRALLADPKVHMFAMTSGTTAARKFIPVTDQYLADYQRGWNLWGLKVYRDHRRGPLSAHRAVVGRLAGIHDTEPASRAAASPA